MNYETSTECIQCLVKLPAIVGLATGQITEWLYKLCKCIVLSSLKSDARLTPTDMLLFPRVHKREKIKNRT